MKVRELVVKPPDRPPKAGEPWNSVSGIIQWLLRQREPLRYGKDKNEGDYWNFELGWSWEDLALSEGFLKRVSPMKGLEYQVAASLDGITGHPDAIVRAKKTIIECKLTDLLCAPITESRFLKYHWQGMAYCRLFGWSKVVYLLCHVRGDYKEAERRTVRAWECSYSSAELVRNWRMLTNAREDMMDERKEDGNGTKGRTRLG